MNLLIHGLLLTISSSLYAALSKIIIVVYYKIKMPVLYGECGKPSLHFEADAFNPNNNIVIEVEAGRAVTNYQFLKDFFESCCMDDADYLCIAVRLLYRKNDDYKKVCEFFDAMYASNKFSIPLKGILIIGY